MGKRPRPAERARRRGLDRPPLPLDRDRAETRARPGRSPQDSRAPL